MFRRQTKEPGWQGHKGALRGPLYISPYFPLWALGPCGAQGPPGGPRGALGAPGAPWGPVGPISAALRGCAKRILMAGLAAVAECRGDLEAAAGFYEQAESTAGGSSRFRSDPITPTTTRTRRFPPRAMPGKPPKMRTFRRT